MNISDISGFHIGEREEQEDNSVAVVEEGEYQYADFTKKKEFRQTRIKDKEDRATVEQCLDPRTRVILMKMLNKRFLREINGCISTGKEANVYHGWDFENKEYAIKIYKTSILVFKDRDKYINGEFRFRNGHCKSNPRKMVRLWAEKEFRNLKRIQQSRIPCPEPILVKSNLILMEFIGEDMVAAPRLKDAQDVLYEDAYLQLIFSMRILYQECKLIHGDLSEYNLLYYKQKLYFIDVSQSMENDHPYASDFLKRDIINVNDYFKKKGIMTFTLRQLYKFITDEHIADVHAAAKQMAEERELIDEEKEQAEDKVFVGAIQPQDLSELPMKILEAELDQIRLNSEKNDTKTIQDFQNVKIAKEEQNKAKVSEEDSAEEDGSDSDDSSDVSLLSEDDSESQAAGEGEPEGEEAKEKKKGGLCKYDGMTKQERKKLVKEEKREKRKNKLPKSIKKQMTKKKR